MKFLIILRDVPPSIAVEDHSVRFGRQIAELQEAWVAFLRVVKAVVRLGEALAVPY